MHVTETCDVEQPHLIVHVATTPAPKSDVAMTEVIQADLQRAQRLPGQHLLDAGYINADVLAQAEPRFGMQVISPTHPDVKWQATTEEANRCESVCHRLVRQAGHLSARAYERRLDANV